MTKTDLQRRHTVIQPVTRNFRFMLHNSFAQDPKNNSSSSDDNDAIVGKEEATSSATASQDVVLIKHDFYHKVPALKQIRDKFFPNKFAEIQVELSVHSCSASMFNEVKFVFPVLSCRQDLWIVPVFQHTLLDILGTGPHVEQEKSRCLENVYLLGYTLCLAVRENGYWADFTDPASAFPVLVNNYYYYYHYLKSECNVKISHAINANV